MIFRDRVELAIPARMMFAISMMGVFVMTDEEKGREDLERMRHLLKVACLEPLDGLPIKLARVVGKSIDRTHNLVMAEYDKSRADKTATAIYYFLKELTDTGYLELYEGSPMAEAAAMYLGMIEHVFDEDKLDASAQKQSRSIMKKLQKMGYYV